MPVGHLIMDIREATANVVSARASVASGIDTRVAPYTMDDVSSGFRASDPDVPVLRTHHLRMVLLSLVMLAFPASALAFMCVMAVLFGLGIDGIRQGLVAEAPMLACGGILMCVASVVLLMRMIYRIMADWRRNYVNVRLRKQEYPVLYRYVSVVAELLKGDAPDVIILDNETGLMLREQVGPGGQREVALVIGLPLLYSMSARQLSGLIAHAYGSVSGTHARRGYAFITNINRWLVRMGEGEASRQYDASNARLTVGVVAPFDWVLQMFFRGLSQIAGCLSFSTSRLMDLQGDRYSARLAGASEFRATQLRLRALQLSKSRVLKRLAQEGTPGHSNLALWMAFEAEGLQRELRQQFVSEMEDLVSPVSRSRIVDLGRIVEVERSHDEGECFLLGSALRLVPHVDIVGEQLGAMWLGARGRGL